MRFDLVGAPLDKVKRRFRRQNNVLQWVSSPT